MNVAPERVPLKIAVIAAHPLTRDILTHLLRRAAPTSEVWHYDFSELVSSDLESRRFDLFVLAQWPGDGTLDAVDIMLRKRSDAIIILIADEADPNLAQEALRRGVRGVISTRLTVLAARVALRVILSGGTFAHGRVVEAMPRNDAPRGPHHAFALSPREHQVLNLLREGRSNKQIAVALSISENTVTIHVRNLLRKLGATNRTEAVFKAGAKVRSGAR